MFASYSPAMNATRWMTEASTAKVREQMLDVIMAEAPNTHAIVLTRPESDRNVVGMVKLTWTSKEGAEADRERALRRSRDYRDGCLLKIEQGKDQPVKSGKKTEEARRAEIEAGYQASLLGIEKTFQQSIGKVEFAIDTLQGDGRVPGSADRLMLALLEFVQARGFTHLEADVKKTNAGSVALLRRWGFKLGECEPPDLVYERDLSPLR